MKGEGMNTNPITQMQHTINNVAHFLEFKINALVAVLDKAIPGFAEAYEKQLFYSKCFGVMAGSEQIRQKPEAQGDAVGMLRANTKLIEELSKQAEAKGWMELFQKAQDEAKKKVAEAKEGQDVTGIRVIKP
jgi:hypothetical protein